MARHSEQRRPDPVSFRLDVHFMSLLRQRAEGLNTSPGDCARRLVVDGLSGGEAATLRDEVSELRSEVAELRKLLTGLAKRDESGLLRKEFAEYTSVFRTVVVALLVGGGRLETEEALAWVGSNLGLPEGEG